MRVQGTKTLWRLDSDYSKYLSNIISAGLQGQEIVLVRRH